MRRKGHPHCELSDEEKIFFANRKTSIAERRRERKKRRKINLELEKEGKTESTEYGQAA